MKLNKIWPWAEQDVCFQIIPPTLFIQAQGKSIDLI